MWDAFLKYWLTWSCGIIAGLLLFFRKKMTAWYKARREKRAADEFADRYVLFMKLRELYKEAQEQGYVTVDDMADAEQTYIHYHNMGGNGRATVMIQAMRDMEVK